MMSFGLCSCARLLHLVVVDDFVRIEPVAHDLEPLAAHVERHAVREMAAFGQAHAHDGVARLKQARRTRPDWPVSPELA